MVNLNNWPGVAPFAQQGGRYVAKLISNELDGASPTQRKPFKYFDKGSMATVSRYSAVVKVGKFEISGFVAWVMWLAVHLATLVGFRNRFMAIVSWGMQVNGNRRAQLTSTKQWAYGRQAMMRLEDKNTSGS